MHLEKNAINSQRNRKFNILSNQNKSWDVCEGKRNYLKIVRTNTRALSKLSNCTCIGGDKRFNVCIRDSTCLMRDHILCVLIALISSSWISMCVIIHTLNNKFTSCFASFSIIKQRYSVLIYALQLQPNRIFSSHLFPFSLILAYQRKSLVHALIWFFFAVVFRFVFISRKKRIF